MAVITISRQFGSGGDQIAAYICGQLGYRYFGKGLMVKAAAEAGIAPEDMVDLSEDTYRVKTFIDHLLTGWRAPHAIAQTDIWEREIMSYQVDEVAELDEAHNIAMVQSALRITYDHGNVVILGRGGQAYFRDKPDVLHVRIQAPLDARIERVQARENTEQAAAKAHIDQRDIAAARYLKRFYHIDWADPEHYHLVLNTGKFSAENAADVIINAVQYLPERETS